ncbi:MAG: DUF2384 domain-containing protein [Opitutaceae bacterium]|nr:DUF2384 domain-containing protein [Cytophagales bacterium]
MATNDILNSIPSRMTSGEIVQYIYSQKITGNYINALKNYSHYNDVVLSAWLNLNVKTYRTYKESSSTLNANLQEHVIMLLSLLKHGIDIFGTSEDFYKWLETPNFQFSGKGPFDFLGTINGIKMVDDSLTGIEYGDNS